MKQSLLIDFMAAIILILMLWSLQAGNSAVVWYLLAALGAGLLLSWRRHHLLYRNLVRKHLKAPQMLFLFAVLVGYWLWWLEDDNMDERLPLYLIIAGIAGAILAWVWWKRYGES